MLTLDKTCDIFKIKNIIYIQIQNPIIFESRFSSDRYGDEANVKLHKYGKSLIETKVSHNDIIYKITGYEVMRGSVGYVGSLIIGVEKC